MRTVKRTFSILEAFDAEQPILPLHEIASKVNLSSPTTLRILKSLVDLGYLVRLDKSKYCLSPRILRLSAAVKSTMDIREISYDVALDVAAATQEVIAIYMLDEMERVCIYAVDSELRLKSVIKPGDRSDLGVGASGKVILAYQEADVIAKNLARLKRKHGVDISALRAELEEVRRTGLAQSLEEVTPGNAAVAAPIFELDGSVKFSISLACPAMRFEGKEAFFKDQIAKAAILISQRNGAEVAFD